MCGDDRKKYVDYMLNGKEIDEFFLDVNLANKKAQQFLQHGSLHHICTVIVKNEIIVCCKGSSAKGLFVLL
jgi:hypothetical protein